MSNKITIKSLIENIFDCRFPSGELENTVADYFANDTYVPFKNANIADIKLMFEVMSKNNDYSVIGKDGSLAIIDTEKFSKADKAKAKHLLKNVPSMKCIYLAFMKAATEIIERDGIELDAILGRTDLIDCRKDWYRFSIVQNSKCEGQFANNGYDTLIVSRDGVFYYFDPPIKDWSSCKGWSVWRDNAKEIQDLKDYVIHKVLGNPFGDCLDPNDYSRLFLMEEGVIRFMYFKYEIHFTDGSYFTFRTTELRGSAFEYLRACLAFSIPEGLEGPCWLTMRHIHLNDD